MHEPPGKFAPLRVGDIVQLARESPLAWLVSPLYATVLPILARTDATTAVTEVRGHFSRANPQHAELEDNPRATILLMGPNSYMSPSWLSDRTQAPTWMYAAVRFSVEIELIADSAGIERHLGELVKAMEHGRVRQACSTGWRAITRSVGRQPIDARRARPRSGSMLHTLPCPKPSRRRSKRVPPE